MNNKDRQAPAVKRDQGKNIEEKEKEKGISKKKNIRKIRDEDETEIDHDENEAEEEEEEEAPEMVWMLSFIYSSVVSFFQIHLSHLF